MFCTQNLIYILVIRCIFTFEKRAFVLVIQWWIFLFNLMILLMQSSLNKCGDASLMSLSYFAIVLIEQLQLPLPPWEFCVYFSLYTQGLIYEEQILYCE